MESEGRMSKKDRDAELAAGPSPGTRAFIARRAAMEEARIAADAAEAERQQKLLAHRRTDYQNPIAVAVGLAVLALLLIGFVFVIDQLRSDPWFSDCPTGRGNCR
jgi:hypothetical protein